MGKMHGPVVVDPLTFSSCFEFTASDGGSTPVMDERSDEEDIRQDEDLEVSTM